MQAVSMQRLMHAINALYENTFDDTAIGGASQIIKGHNHDNTGGGALPRGLSWSTDFGLEAVHSTDFSKTILDQVLVVSNHIRYLVSPKMDNNGFLQGWVLYSAKDSDIDLEIRETYTGKAKKRTIATLPKTFDQDYDEVLKWASVTVPLGEGDLNKIQIKAIIQSFEEDLVPALKIYAFQWAEVSGVSYGLRGEKI